MLRYASVVIVLVVLSACSASSEDAKDGDGDGDASTHGDDSGSSIDGGATSDSGSLGEGGGGGSTRPSTLGGSSVLGSLGCSAGAGATGVQNIALTVDGGARTGIFFVPADYDPSKAYPIVFVFHGDGGNGAGIRPALDLEPDANGKAIFAYPDGANQTWDDNVDTSNQDMAFVMAVRESIRSKYCIDTTRTFLTGMSRGGYFVNQIACLYGIAEFAAIAPHSSTMGATDDSAYIYGPYNPNGGPYLPGNYDFACPSDGKPYPAKPKLPPPVFVVHGECDMEEGVTYAQGRAVAEHWGYAARCTTTPNVEVTTNPDSACAAPFSNDPALTVDPCYVAPGCAAGHDVTFCSIPGMDHNVWADAHTRIWDFFAGH
jgi:polyhydroxybutyrate depolymerase